MPKITIERPHEWANQTKNIHIFIDDKKVGTIGKGKTMDFDVSPGKHKVLLKSNWLGGSKPLEVDMSDNENRTIKMTSFKYRFIIAPFLVFISFIIYYGVVAIFGLESNFLSNVLVVLSLYVIFYYLFFRMRYLKLQEVDSIKDEEIF